MTDHSKTIGEIRARTPLTVSENDPISIIKVKTAELINLCEELKKKDVRLGALAQTSFEQGLVWAERATSV